MNDVSVVEEKPSQKGGTHGLNLSALDRERRELDLANEEIALRVRDLDLYYGEKQALQKINMDIPRQRVTAYIGPSGCGKSTLLALFQSNERSGRWCHDRWTH